MLRTLDSVQHMQRSMFQVQATGIRASGDLDKAGEAAINKITCSIIQFSRAVTEPDGTRPGGNDQRVGGGEIPGGRQS